jgi:hypothetical protein
MGVVCPESRTEAPLQTDGALDHYAFNNSDDDTLTHRIPQTSPPGFAKTLTGTATNGGRKPGRGASKFGRLQQQQDCRSIAHSPRNKRLQANQDHRGLEQEIEELEEQQQNSRVGMHCAMAPVTMPSMYFVLGHSLWMMPCHDACVHSASTVSTSAWSALASAPRWRARCGVERAGPVVTA